MAQRLKQLGQVLKGHPKLSATIVTLTALTLAIRKYQYKLVYIPKIDGIKTPANNHHPYRNPTEYGFSQWEDIQLETSDHIKLRGWFIKYKSGKPKRIIIYYHQNAGNIGHRLPFLKNLINRTQSHVLLVAYRGYSDSEGIPSQKGLKIDSLTILQKAIQLKKQHNQLPLYVYGRSLGGAAAIYACSQPQYKQSFQGLIIQNTFTSIKDVVTNILSSPLLKGISSIFLLFLLSNKWQSNKIIHKISKPIMFIKSCKDELIPKNQMDRLQNLSKSQIKQSYEIEEGTHNETWSLQLKQYFYRLGSFMDNHQGRM